MYKVDLDGIGVRLKNAIKIRGTNTYRMACNLGLAKDTMYRYSKGGVVPHIDTVKAICEYLQVSPNYLLGWEDDSEG